MLFVRPQIFLNDKKGQMGTSKYNLELLGWYNFEQLVRTLLRQIVGNGLSSFSGSVDQGRDAVFSGESTSFPSDSERWRGEWIFQIKHRTYSTRGANVVRTELKRTLPTEVHRMLNKHNHECKNYLAITNCPLTAQDKDELTFLIRSVSTDIHNVAVLGEADLQELLDGHPKVVSAFPQLLGISQLRELLEWGLHSRSLEYLLSAQAEIATFVATSPYMKAIDLLHKQHFCVLSGPPKMGKTCIAYALAAAFSALKYEVYELRNQRDFYSAFQPDVKQLFICDDVFGDISMNPAQRDDWTRGLLRLIGNLGRDHKLVWTARQYILNEAFASSRLKEERPELAKTDMVTVAVDDLSRQEKAMILYNNARVAYFPDEVRNYLRGKACITITDHPNYSPESIRQLCKGGLVSFSNSVDKNPKTTIAEQVHAFLSAPGEAWKTAYLSASSGERLLCTEVMAAGGNIQLSQLQQRYEQAIINEAELFQSFETSIANAKGTFLRYKYHFSGDHFVQFYHPSMRDLLSELIKNDKTTRIAYLKQLALKELPAIARPMRVLVLGGSEEHRIAITDNSDIEFLQNHIKKTLLPDAELPDVLAVITFLHSTLNQSKVKLVTKSSRDLSNFGNVFWVIFDSVVPHLCSEKFWQKNSEIAGDLINWRRLFEIFRSLLPLASVPLTPVYVPDLLKRRKMYSSVDYWGLVMAAHAIVPTVVEQCVDLSAREMCRQHLVEVIEQAIGEANLLNLADDYDDSQQWYDEYESISVDSEDYAILFPDDEIQGLTELSKVIDDYPRLEDQPDEEEDYSSQRSLNSSSDTEIQELFSDL